MTAVPATPVRCSPMVEGDLDMVLDLAAAAFPGSWSPTALRDELARPDRRYLVARRGGEVVGHGGIADLAGEAHVMTLATAPAHRRSGVATAVLHALLVAARDELGSARVTLEVRASNRAALQLYAGAGFAVAGPRPGYYPDGEAALVLWCDDPGAALRSLDDALRAVPGGVPTAPAPTDGRG